MRTARTGTEDVWRRTHLNHNTTHQNHEVQHVTFRLRWGMAGDLSPLGLTSRLCLREQPSAERVRTSYSPHEGRRLLRYGFTDIRGGSSGTNTTLRIKRKATPHPPFVLLSGGRWRRTSTKTWFYNIMTEVESSLKNYNFMLIYPPSSLPIRLYLTLNLHDNPSTGSLLTRK